VELLGMDDPQAPPKGTMGEILGVDDAGQILVHWQTGSSLNLLPSIDSFRIISPDMSDEAEALRELARDSCNVVALAPGRVIGYAHNQRANDALRKAGIEVVETPGVELVRGRGGAPGSGGRRRACSGRR